MRTSSQTTTGMIFAAGALLCSYAAALYGIYSITPDVCEDTYITFRFSRNLAEGLGPVFNAGEQVEGYSNFLWMLTLAAVHALGLDMSLFSRLAGAFFNTLCLLIVWYIPCRFFAVRGPGSLCAPLLYLLFVPFHFYAASGLETSLYILLVLLVVLTLLAARGRTVPCTAAGLLLLLLALTRPEGILFFFFFCAFLCWRAATGKESLRPYLPGIILCAAGFGAFILWRLSYYGAPLPNTYYAKGSFPLPLRLLFGFFMNKGFLTHYPHFLFVLSLLMVPARAAGNRAPLLVFIAAGMCFSLCFSGFDWMPFFRYTLPVVPLLIICCQIGFTQVWETKIAAARKRVKVLWCGSVLLLFCFAAEQYWQDIAFTIRWQDITNFGRHNQKKVGEWLRQAPGQQPRIAIGDVGCLAYVAETPIIDIFGLTSREFAEIKNRFGFPQIHLSRPVISFDRYKEKERELLLRLAPDYIFLYNARLKTTNTFPGSSAGIVEHRDFSDRYEYSTTFYIMPRFSSPAWPKLFHCIDILDLSAGLLAWIENGWGYDVYIRRDSPCSRFSLAFFPDERISSITPQP
jgi:hypothetical protein